MRFGATLVVLNPKLASVFRIIRVVILVASSSWYGHLGVAQSHPDEPHPTANAAIQPYFRHKTEQLAITVLDRVQTLEDWQQMRPSLRTQLLEMLGLDPLPERTALHATTTGTTEQDGFVVENLHFQSRPGLYVTANFYRPKQVDRPLPTILYLCGHGNVKVDGVSYGSKANYQHHAAWFAREGYCCLILDTLQLGEIEGLHHGTYREGMWWWLARGYTPAGVEAWNAVRALDYLETRPDVDMNRIGVTGRSGGGAYTWWLAAIDDRPACIVPVAGITDLENHVVDGCIEGHCDCMFMINTYAWDFDMVAALAAPRPLLFSNSDKDTIFPLSGVVRTHAKLQKIYALHNAPEKLGLLITEGPHKDTQDLQVPAFRWMNRWLQNKDEPITRIADKPVDIKQLRVLQELPEDQRNTTIHESFVPLAVSTLPRDRDDWDVQRQNWLKAIKEKSFGGWPKSPPALDIKQLGQKVASGVRLQVFEYSSEQDIRLNLYELGGAKWPSHSMTEVTVLGREAWDEWRSAWALVFPELLGDTSSGSQPTDDIEFLQRHDCARVVAVPRGVGPGQWPGDARKDTHIQRRLPLIGQSWDGMQVWDITRAIQAVQEIHADKPSTIRLQARNGQAGIALYAGIFSPAVAEVYLHNPPLTHRHGAYFLNVLRILDMPQAVALAFPRRVVIHDSDPTNWEWPVAVGRLLDGTDGLIQFSGNGN